jgi:hypothetical protein
VDATRRDGRETPNNECFLPFVIFALFAVKVIIQTAKIAEIAKIEIR